MSKSSSTGEKFSAHVWPILRHANDMGIECTVVWRISEEDFTCASTLESSNEVRARLIEVVARTVIRDGHLPEEIGDVAAADYCAARDSALKQKGEKNGET